MRKVSEHESGNWSGNHRGGGIIGSEWLVLFQDTKERPRDQ